MFGCCNFVCWVCCDAVWDGGFGVVLLACLCLCGVFACGVWFCDCAGSWFSGFWFRELSGVWFSCWVLGFVLAWSFVMRFLGVI